MKHLLFIASLIVGSFIVVVSVFGGASKLTSTGKATSATSTGPCQSAINHPVLPHGFAPGVPGIPITHCGHIPVFTVADVRAYYQKYSFEGAHTDRITLIAFMTSAQAEAKMKGESTGMPHPTDIVCYVEFRGPFVFNDVPRPLGAAPPHARFGHVVYDAATGNEMVWGGTD